MDKGRLADGVAAYYANQQPSIRRINRLPVIVALVLVLLFLGVIF